MILSDQSIKRLMASNELEISPLNPTQIQPASVDCTLGTHFLRMNDSQKNPFRFTPQLNMLSSLHLKSLFRLNHFYWQQPMSICDCPITLQPLLRDEVQLGGWGYLFKMQAG